TLFRSQPVPDRIRREYDRLPDISIRPPLGDVVPNRLTRLCPDSRRMLAQVVVQVRLHRLFNGDPIRRSVVFHASPPPSSAGECLSAAIALSRILAHVFSACKTCAPKVSHDHPARRATSPASGGKRGAAGPRAYLCARRAR